MPERSIQRFPKSDLKDPEEIREAKGHYLQALQETGLQSKALVLAGVTLKQVERFREDEEFASLERQAELFQDDILRDQINQYIKQGDKQIIISAMRKLPEYNPSKKTEVSVSGQIVHKAIAALPESELDHLIAEGHKLVELDKEDYDVEEEGQ